MFHLILPFEQHLFGTLRILYCTPLILQEQVRVTALGVIFVLLFSFDPALMVEKVTKKIKVR